jgi:hypothetical protein
MDWASLFDRTVDHEVDEAAVVAALAERRAGADGDEGDTGDAGDDGRSETGGGDGTGERGREPGDPARPDPSPARVVADADVLAADLLVGDPARAALDGLRRHSWTHLLASDPLLADATAVVAALSSPGLAADWRDRVAAWREPVTHPAGDHPALASAYRGGAMHVLSLDDRLTGAAAGTRLRGRFPVSVRHPRAFAALFDPDSLYREVVGGEYPGPDRDPRA